MPHYELRNTKVNTVLLVRGTIQKLNGHIQFYKQIAGFNRENLTITISIEKEHKGVINKGIFRDHSINFKRVLRIIGS